MSVKHHEAYCLDSISKRCDGFDHFWGDSLDAKWRNTLGGGGTGAVVDAMTGAIFRLGTPTASDSSTLDWGDIRSLHFSKNICLESHVRANDGVTDTTRYLCTLYYDGNNYIAFYHDYDSLDIHIICVDGGVPTDQDSGINLDGNYHKYRIEAHGVAGVAFYIDDVETSNSPITTNIPDDAGDYLQPFYGITSNADTDPATTMDVDYLWWRQNR